MYCFSHNNSVFPADQMNPLSFREFATPSAKTPRSTNPSKNPRRKTFPARRYRMFTPGAKMSGPSGNQKPVFKLEDYSHEGTPIYLPTMNAADQQHVLRNYGRIGTWSSLKPF